MAFYGYKGDLDEYHLSPYNTTYDYNFFYTQIQTQTEYDHQPEFIEPAFVPPVEANYPVYTSPEPEIFQDEPTEYYSSYSYYEHSVNPPEINFSSEETNLLQYNPPSSYARIFFPAKSKFTISYSTAKFNEPEFKEYDPTPYGGGYDPVVTYGKPVPPSDITCYPRSSPKPMNTAMESFSFASVPSPYDKDDGPNGKSKDAKTKPSNGTKPEDAKTGNIKKEDEAENDEVKPSNGTKPEDAKRGGFKKEDEAENDEAKPSNGTKLENAKTGSFEKEAEAGNDEAKPSNGTKPEDAKAGRFENEDEVDNKKTSDRGYEIESYGYGDERHLPRIPYGSGLEAMDICESLFGYWPCLAKRAQEQNRDKCRRHFCDRERNVNPWESAADYLFGSPSFYDYESYHQQQQYSQYKSWENSWLQ